METVAILWERKRNWKLICPGNAMQNIMIDLETMGNGSHAAICAIGAVVKRDLPFEGTPHFALDDAKYQARYVGAIYQKLKGAISS